ncbi:MAG: peptidase C39 family protein [Patescibacteria group bacterium]
MKLDVPFYKQDTDYTCGPASLQMVMDFLGEFRSEKKLAKEANTLSTRGTKHGGLMEAVSKEGFYSYVNKNSNVEEIKHFLKMGLPVIVDITAEKEGHYAVAVGFKDGKIILNDPWYGKGVKKPEKEFMENWHDENFRNWIMVISDKDFNLGKQYKPASK